MSSKSDNNKQILDSIANDDGNKEHILARLLKRFNLKRRLALALKHDRQDREKAQANIELYLDDWAFHRGPITKANVHEALADCVDRMVTLHRKKRQKANDAAFREMQGPLVEFDDEPFEQLPGDGDFEKLWKK